MCKIHEFNQAELRKWKETMNYNLQYFAFSTFAFKFIILNHNSSSLIFYFCCCIVYKIQNITAYASHGSVVKGINYVRALVFLVETRI